MITQEYVHSRIYYDLLTGKFWWKPRGNPQWDGRQAGKEAGTVMKNKYGIHRAYIMLDGISYLAHRLAWFYMLGVWPVEVDHEDHNSLNNSWINLKDVSHAENGKNRKKSITNTSGVTGVRLDTAKGKWHAFIRVNGKDKHGGFFTNFEDAVNRRKELELEHNFHPNHGK